MPIIDIKRRNTSELTLQVKKNSESKEIKCKGVKNAYYKETGVFNTYRLVGTFVGGFFIFEDQAGKDFTVSAERRTGVIHVSKEFLAALNGMQAMCIELSLPGGWYYSQQLEDEERGIDKDSLLYGSYRLSLPPGVVEDDIVAMGVAGKIDDVTRHMEADAANLARQDEYDAEHGKAIASMAAEGGKKAKLL